MERHLYQEPESIVAITAAVDGRRPVFSNQAIAQECVELLEQRALDLDVSVMAYCFMPEHLHLLLYILGSGNVIDFMRDYKGRTARLFWQHGLHGKVWQRSFYDHILRESDDPMKHIRYVPENPVRSGIVESFREYPWCGSFEFDVLDPEFWEENSR